MGKSGKGELWYSQLRSTSGQIIQHIHGGILDIMFHDPTKEVRLFFESKVHKISG